MDISVTDFKAQCLDLIRQVEKSRKPITIRRRGRVVARLEPASSLPAGLKPWERLQAMGGSADIDPGESVLRNEDFEALR